MDVFEAIEKRASVRQFEPVDISDVDLEKILDAGRRAPSGKNLQPLSYVVIRSKETLEQLSRCQGCIGDASVAVCIVADPEASEYWLEDASSAAENMLLALKALGYDSVWVEGTVRRHEGFAKELLGIPAKSRLIIVLPIGKAAGSAEQAEKKPLEQLVHWEKW